MGKFTGVYPRPTNLLTDPAVRLSAALTDRYRIERELGRGGMGAVSLSNDPRLDRIEALLADTSKRLDKA